MVNVFNELITSETSTEEQLIQWKYDTRGIFNCFKNFYTKEATIDHAFSKLKCCSIKITFT